mmetsp:Transcript_59830/g.146931  ORF Transcript_59830/g.146931 Transcript_59830/m.146931 type:complete len:189 (+) Transcript_59830:150-716(+)
MKLKFLILGGSRAGKTSLLRRYFNNSFEPQRRTPTLGSDFYSKKIEVDDEDIFDQTHRQDQDKEKQKEQEQKQEGEIEKGKSTATNTTTNDNFNNGNIYQIEGTISDDVNGGHDGGEKHNPHRPPRHPSASNETNSNISKRTPPPTTTNHTSTTDDDHDADEDDHHNDNDDDDRAKAYENPTPFIEVC